MNLFVSFFFTLWTWVLPGTATSETDINQTVGISLRSGDASQLSARFAKTIELIIDTENVEFQAVQATHAELILRTFFRKHPPHSFKFVHRGASDKLRYSTGVYETDGQAFTVYVLMRQTSGQQYAINALHFRKGKREE
jgi:hypothetical protein